MKNKKETRNQRLRREKGLARAEVNLDVLEKKTEKSRERAKVILDRSKAWEEVDGKKTKVQKGEGKANTFGTLNGEGIGEDDWEDEEDDMMLKSSKTTEDSAKTTQIGSQQLPVDTIEDEIT